MLKAMPALAAESVAAARESEVHVEPWLWSASRDLWLFGGSALGALLLVALGHALRFAGGPLPEWAFLVFVLGVDVAHVYATLFRTYLLDTRLWRAEETQRLPAQRRALGLSRAKGAQS